MALQDLRKGKDLPTPPASGVGTLTAFIDQGSEFTGKLAFKDTVRIDGRFEGEIASENTLIVGETGSIDAKIQSQIVIVSGEVRGDIVATRQITLHKSARVNGNLRTQSLAVEEGAQFNGQVQMGASAPSASAKPPAGDKSGEKKPAGDPTDH